MQPSLVLYRHLDQIGWLRTYSRKVLFVAFLGTHVPLIGLIVYLSTRYEPMQPSAAIYVTLVATLLGTFAALWTLDRLLVPIRMATGALDTYLETGRVQELPADLRDEAGTLLRDVNRSVHAFEQHRCELERVAQTDALTGLWNRRGMEARMRDRALDGEDVVTCFAIIDIDHFKALNDTWGHAVGDIALQRVAGCLRRTLAATCGGDSALVARWGGEEFLLLLPFPVEQAVACIERMRHDLRSVRFRGDDIADAQSTRADRVESVLPTAITITISAGLSAVRAADEASERSIIRADHALYRAKQQGRDRVCIADE